MHIFTWSRTTQGAGGNKVYSSERGLGKELNENASGKEAVTKVTCADGCQRIEYRGVFPVSIHLSALFFPEPLY